MKLSDIPSLNHFTLDLLRVGVTQRLGAFMASRMRVDEWMDHMTDSMVVTLSTDVLAHKVGTDEVVVPFERRVPIPGRAVMVFALALGCSACVVLATVSTLMLAPAVLLMALYWGVAFGPTHVTVKGEVVVPVTMFNTFPQADIAYPDNLGRKVQVVTQSEPYFRWSE